MSTRTTRFATFDDVSTVMTRASHTNLTPYTEEKAIYEHAQNVEVEEEDDDDDDEDMVDEDEDDDEDDDFEADGRVTEEDDSLSSSVTENEPSSSSLSYSSVYSQSDTFSDDTSTLACSVSAFELPRTDSIFQLVGSESLPNTYSSINSALDRRSVSPLPKSSSSLIHRRPHTAAASTSSTTTATAANPTTTTTTSLSSTSSYNAHQSSYSSGAGAAARGLVRVSGGPVTSRESSSSSYSSSSGEHAQMARMARRRTRTLNSPGTAPQRRGASSGPETRSSLQRRRSELKIADPERQRRRHSLRLGSRISLHREQTTTSSTATSPQPTPKGNSELRAAKQNLTYLKQQRDLLEKSIVRHKKQLLLAVEHENDLAAQVGEFFHADVVLPITCSRAGSFIEGTGGSRSSISGQPQQQQQQSSRNEMAKQRRAKLKEVLASTSWFGTCLLPRRRTTALWTETVAFPEGFRLRVKRFLPSDDSTHDKTELKQRVARAREAYKLIRGLSNHPNVAVPLVTLSRKSSQSLFLFFAHSSTTLRQELDLRKSRDEVYVPKAAEVILWATEICHGLLHLTNAGIIHGDLRAAVIAASLAQDGSLHSLKIMDLEETARRASNCTGPSDFEDTNRFWQAPELLLSGSPACSNEDTEAYSFGMTIYEMLSGGTPYEHAPASFIELAVAGVRPELSAQLADDPDLNKMSNLFCALTSPTPSQRPSFVKVDRELVRIRLGCEVLSRQMLSPNATPRGRS
eukprot:CAMPEP_0177661788 /NCGR_PEP_ID=MMETSP0447-20121125/18898_1 /TAXON_ID=0 /ORGANISM="Stygamoeba regulata, Strain BSH-02190019" /LENGTH=744 /DNA_ID=CAMNT_0019167219 /DNA_START=335 /DNA_END=2569 /DNA_ORIENTATION=+